jgi:hypothetical protein
MSPPPGWPYNIAVGPIVFHYRNRRSYVEIALLSFWSFTSFVGYSVTSHSLSYSEMPPMKAWAYPCLMIAILLLFADVRAILMTLNSRVVVFEGTISWIDLVRRHRLATPIRSATIVCFPELHCVWDLARITTDRGIIPIGHAISQSARLKEIILIQSTLPQIRRAAALEDAEPGRS